MKKITQLFLLLVTCLLPAPLVNGQLVVYEGFDYADGSTLGGANGGLGFSSGWTSTNGTGPELTVDVSENLSVGGLETSGGFISRVNRTNFTTITRTLDSASVTSLTGDGTTLWGSFVYRDGNGDGFNPDSSLTLASVPTALANFPQLSAVGVGVGLSIGDIGVDTGGIFYDPAPADPLVDPVSPNPTYGPTTLTDADITGNDPDGTPNPDVITTTLFVFSVDWSADGTDDVLTFYNVTDPTAALPAAFSTTTFDYSSTEQASINSLNIIESQTGEFDEIRLGTTLESVLPASPVEVLLGDVDLSGTVDFSDISPFIAVLSSGEFQAEADCDESGTVDFSDISSFITILSGS